MKGARGRGAGLLALAVLAALAAPGSAQERQEDEHSYWMEARDFSGNDLRPERGGAEECSGTCQGEAECTHYSWSDFGGGTCWLKRGDPPATSDIRGTMGRCGVLKRYADLKLAERYAPKLLLDQKAFDEDTCMPEDAGEFYRARKESDDIRCSTDVAGVKGGRVPTYIQVARNCGGDVIVAYWTFYGHQKPCLVIRTPWPLPDIKQGEHVGDWERIMVRVEGCKGGVEDLGCSEGRLARVKFFQHGGHYTRESGSFETQSDTRPVVYIGKNAHGSYHDRCSGSSCVGGCAYYEDFRNPDSDPIFLEAWKNLALFDREQEWNKDFGAWESWDAPTHPLARNEDLCAFPGCTKGCDGFLGQGCGTDQAGGCATDYTQLDSSQGF